MAKKKTKKKNSSNGTTIGFEEKLWIAADKLRGLINAAEYKHVVLGLLFLKYIPDLQTPTHKRVLETEEVEDIADAKASRSVAVAGIRLAVMKAHLEAQPVEDVESAFTGGLIAIRKAECGVHALDIRKWPGRTTTSDCKHAPVFP